MVCILTFKDGRQVKATMHADSPDTDSPIEYAGAIELLPRRFAVGAPADLRILFENLSKELGASLSVRQEGEYERWAE